MSDEGEFIVINMDSDSDNNISDDGDELLSEYFGSDVIPDASSDGDLTLESELEDSDDNFEEQSLHDIEDEYDEDNGVDGGDNEEEGEDDNDDGEEILLPENLKRPNPSWVGFYPGNKRIRPSAPDDFMRLEELLERTDRQITNIYDTVSRMQEVHEMPQMETCGSCGDVVSHTEQATQSQDNPEETLPQPVAEAKFGKLLSNPDTAPNDEGAQRNENSVTSSEQPAVEAPVAFLQSVDSILANHPNGVIYPVFEGIEAVRTNTVSSYIYIPPNLDIPELTGVNAGNRALIMTKPNSEENNEDNFNPPIFHSFDLPVIPEAVLGNNPEMVNYPPAMGNIIDQQNLPSSIRPVSDSEIEEVVLVEMPKKTEVIVDGNKQTVYYPALLGNVVPPDPETIAASISSERVVEKLVLIEVPVHPENIVDDTPEILNNPIILENDGDEEPAAASFFSSGIELSDSAVNNSQIMNKLYVLENNYSQVMPCSVFVHPGLGVTAEIIPPGVNHPTSREHVNVHSDDLVHISDQEGYLGDPRRNIRLPIFHLVTAKCKPTPSYAACYLANLIFSEEILLLSAVADYASRCIFRDHNTMSAIREYLLTVFPNCDLSEQGKDWEDCLSAISFMIDSLYSEAEIPTDRNFSVPISTDWTIRSNDEGEAPSQWFHEVRETVKREIGDLEQNASANPEGTDNAAVIPDELVYLGDPFRNIQIPYSVLKLAKAQLRPYLSAKYIILHLFPEEILIRSNVYGNLECGLFALDPNRIEALREFLQDNYSEYDLEEDEYHWKLCVIAINSCLQMLRQGPRNIVV